MGLAAKQTEALPKPDGPMRDHGKGPPQKDAEETIVAHVLEAVAAEMPHTMPLGPQEEGERVGGENAPACDVLEDKHGHEEIQQQELVDEPVRKKKSGSRRRSRGSGRG